MLEGLRKYFKVAGIYCIYNKLNGKRYIGSSVDIYTRLHRHIGQLKDNTHGNRHLLSAWIKDGEENFDIIIIEIVDSLKELRDIEQIYIDSLFCCDDRFGYNIRPKADFTEISEETKKKISEAGKGRMCSEETRKKLSDSLKNRVFTEEHRNKIVASRQEFYRDPEKVKLVVKLYKQNMKCTDIEKEVKLSRPTIRKILKEVGVFGRSKSFNNIDGKAHGNWKGGKPKCVNCGKELSKYKYTRCVQCTGLVYERK